MLDLVWRWSHSNSDLVCAEFFDRGPRRLAVAIVGGTWVGCNGLLPVLFIHLLFNGKLYFDYKCFQDKIVGNWTAFNNGVRDELNVACGIEVLEIFNRPLGDIRMGLSMSISDLENDGRVVPRYRNGGGEIYLLFFSKWSVRLSL